jgi:hypothetical protein
VEQDGGLNPLLAVLAMTKTSTGPVPTDQQVSIFVIPPGAQAGFLISPERMLMDLLCPKFSLVWPNCRPTDFEYAADMLQLKQGRGFDLPSFTYEGLTYTPHMETLFVSIHEQTLQIDSFTTVPVSPGITATCRSTLTYSIGLASNQNGQTLSFSELPNQPTPIHDIVYADSVTDAQKTINTIAVWGAVISILLAPETLGLSLLVGGLVFGLLAGLTDGTLDEIEKYHLDDAPAIDMLTI